MDDNFRRTFLPKAKNDEKSVIKAFTESNKESALKTKPKVSIPVCVCVKRSKMPCLDC